MTARVFHPVLRYDRDAALLIGLVCVVAVAWMYVVRGAGVELGAAEMGGGQMMRMMRAWTPGYAVLVFLMWAVMMVAMMLPGAVPTLLLVAGRARGSFDQASGVPEAMSFTAGYLAVWAGFSFTATLLQWEFDRAGIQSVAMASSSATVTGLILLVAGLYQLTPLKEACLRHCRSPLHWLTHDRREGAWVIVTTGMRYGLSSLGCCWGLMGLLFVGGVMNVVWIAGLALLVLVEQVLPWGSRVGRLTGAALMVWGAMTLATAAM